MTSTSSQRGLNLELGTQIIYDGEATLNGKEITGPLFLNRKGFFILDVLYEDKRNVITFAAVDLSTLKVGLIGLDSIASSSCYRRLVREMPLSYAMSHNSKPTTANVIQKAHFITNSPVGVTLQMYNKDTDSLLNLSKGMASKPGRFTIPAIIPANGTVDLRVKVVVGPNVYTVGSTGYEAWGEGDWGSIIP